VWIASVPYTGPATLGVILAVTGDVNRFRNYRRYVVYTGYYAGLERSQTIDRTRMSRPLLVAFTCVLTVPFNRGPSDGSEGSI